MSLHPFYKAVYGFTALQALLLAWFLHIVVSGLRIEDGFAIVRYQHRLMLAWIGLRPITTVVVENVLMKHSAVFRRTSAHEQRFLVMSVVQFTNLVGWTGAGLLVAVYAPFNSLASNRQLLHPLGEWFTNAAIADFAADLYRNGGWDLYAHHVVGLMMMVASFEVLPVSLSDPGVIIYAMQNGLDRCVRLLFFWARMRRQQVALRAKGDEERDKESATQNTSTLDRLIPQEAELKRQFTYAFVVYALVIRIVMISAIGAYLWSAWTDMVMGWRIAHLAFPILYGLSDSKFFAYLYRKSSLSRSTPAPAQGKHANVSSHLIH